MGSPQPGQVPLGAERVQAIDARLDKATELAQAVEQKQGQALLSHLDNAQQAHNDFLGQTAGAIGASLESNQVKANKMAGKMVKQADRYISNAYNSAYALGASYPLQQDVITGLETGDYVGTMTAPSYMPQSPPAGQITALPGQNGVVIVPPPPGPINPPPPPPPILPPPPPPPAPGGVCDWHLAPEYQQYEQGLNTNHSLWAGSKGGSVDFFGNPGSANPPQLPEAFIAWRNASTNDPCGTFRRWQLYCCQEDVGTQRGIGAMPCYMPGGTAPGTDKFWMWDGMPLWLRYDGFIYGARSAPPGCIALPSTAAKATSETYTVTTGPGCEPPPPPPPPPPPGDTLPGGTDQCPAQTPVDCTPAQAPSGIGSIAGSSDTCQKLADAVNREQIDKVDPKKLFKMASMGGVGGIAGYIAEAIIGSDQPILPTLCTKFADWINEIITGLSQDANCNGVKLTPFALNQCVLGFLDQWFKCVPSQVTEVVRQLSNTACQSLLPTGSEADGAYLADQIDQTEWECWHKAQGDYIDPAAKVRDSKRVRPDAIQLAQLFRRKQLTQDEFDKATRAAGVTDDKDKKRLFDLTQQWPALGDLVRMMVRDVFDPDTVLDGELDTDFANKFQGKAKDYAAALGVDEDLMRYFWYAHWNVPSFTMLAEMVKRLRPGAVDKELEFTEDDLRKWLQVDDWAPGLIDRMVAVTFNVVTRVDARRMFQLHTITKDELRGYLQDEGYAFDDAQALADFFEKQRSVAEFKTSGQPSVTTAANLFADSIMTEDEMREYVESVALSPDHEGLLLEGFQAKKTYKQRTTATKNVKTGYMRGLFDDGDAISELVSHGIDATQADELISQWRDERESKSKMIPAATLCKWRGMGLIDAQTQAKALARLDFRPDDIANIIGQCEIEWTEKQRKAAERAAAKAQAEIEKAQKKAAADAKAAAKAALDALPCKPAPKPTCPPGPQKKGQTPATTA